MRVEDFWAVDEQVLAHRHARQRVGPPRTTCRRSTRTAASALTVPVLVTGVVRALGLAAVGQEKIAALAVARAGGGRVRDILGRLRTHPVVNVVGNTWRSCHDFRPGGSGEPHVRVLDEALDCFGRRALEGEDSLVLGEEDLMPLEAGLL